MDVRAHRTENGRDLSTAERVVEILHKADGIHALSSDFELLPTCAQTLKPAAI
jgi:hypothetical protein